MRERMGRTAGATNVGALPTVEAASVVVPDATNPVSAAVIHADRARVMGSRAGGARIPATVSEHPVAAVMVRPATESAPAVSVLVATELARALGLAQAPETVSALAVVTGAQVLRVMVRVRLVRESGLADTGAGRPGMSRSVVDSTGTRDVADSAVTATGSGRAVVEMDVARSCGRVKAGRLAVIGMRATKSANSPKRSGWRASCGPFGLDTRILNSLMASNRAISTRVLVSS
jgi:hypothetical protein